MSTDYPDERVIAWVVVHGEDGKGTRIPWLREPKTQEEIRLSAQASGIIHKAQDQEKAQTQLSGSERRHKNRRLRQFRNRLRGNPQV
jgi:hypothetical protein